VAAELPAIQGNSAHFMVYNEFRLAAFAVVGGHSVNARYRADCSQ